MILERPFDVRPADPTDAAAIEAILAANDEWDLPGDPYVEQLLTTPGVRTLVAGARDGALVGFGAVAEIGPLRGSGRMTRHLSDLFVDPGRQGSGVGRALLAALMADAPVRSTFSSADPRALPLYVRFGMVPLWVNVYVRGTLEAVRRTVPLGLDVVAADAAEAGAAERDLTGLDRRVDHERWVARVGGRSFVVRDGERVAAVGASRAARTSPGRWVLHVAVAADADAAAIVRAVLAAEAEVGRADPRAVPGEPVFVGSCVPGPHPVLRGLLEDGFRIVDRDTFQATHPDLVDPTRDILDPGQL